MSLRIRLPLYAGETHDGGCFVAAVERALRCMPRFPSGPTPVTFVISSTAFMMLSNTWPPEWAPHENIDVLAWVCLHFKRRGVMGFVSDDDDELQEVSEDRPLLELLQSHPLAAFGHGVKRAPDLTLGSPGQGTPGSDDVADD